ncbi:arginine/serine-rich coiled-coil protein 2 isoform X2 [Seriola lalandi dorsalis]|uniref:arginine/serine-rich coiled-coil protein 2 isoform X2 n=1 Tax=Seriola lalandi dorsalis TaxID=1841481 RepID=UPI000C6F9073|nr:arginine/serine-rich coiled-coil protein 2 isoform X2 [Seriola lalandi dorsalis]XP_056232717.1 arginine/serine-rich coiled-coil protein 2 isoform X2 [Seriola aureovittata]
MSASDNDSVDLARTGSPVHHRKKHSMDSSRSPRSSKHHHSRSRSRSRERKRDRKNRRSRSRSKEARKRDSEKPSKSHRKTDEQQEQERLSAENGEERSRRKDRRLSKGRSLSRSHSRERRHHSRSRDKRRSRSRSRDRKKKARSRSGSRTKHRHHSKSRSKSRERKKRTEKVRRKSRSRSVNPPAFRGRNTAMDAQEALARRLERAKKLQEQKEKEMLEKQQQQQQEIAAAAPIAAAAAAAAAASNPALNVAALLASGTQVTPQIAMAAQMAALQAKTLAETGIAVPSYYNPSAVNPMKFAEQEKKRKMLWQGKKEGDKSQTAELWEKLNFGNKDQNVKFRKLMGIKGDEDVEVSKPLNDDGLKTLQKQEEMFRNLDVQYEMARSQTHTQRGMGLGFSSSFSRGMDSI